MKVHREGDRLISIGKRLPPGEANAESIGMLAFVGEGPRIFREQAERMMRTPDGVQRWYLRAIDMIAKERTVKTVSIEGLEWPAVDFPADLQIAGALTADWVAAWRDSRCPPSGRSEGRRDGKEDS